MTDWINTNERLPDDYKPYLCYLMSNDYLNECGWYDVLYYDFKNGKWTRNDAGACTQQDIEYLTNWHSVTHWMPLPNPPKEPIKLNRSFICSKKDIHG